MKRIGRVILVAAAFFASLIGVAKVLNGLDPFGEVPIVREKWAWWQKNKDTIDTLYVGTSRTFRGIMPSVFDKMTAEAGVPTKSYNFGVDGMFPPEDAYVGEHLLKDPPKNLKWVFFEMGVFLGDFDGRPPKSVRTVYWHDWTRTWLCMREALWPKKKPVKWKKLFQSDKGRPSPAAIAMTHFEVFLTQSFNIGRGASAWERRAFKRSNGPSGFDMSDSGFLPTTGDGVMRGAELERFEKEYAERQKTPARVVPLRPYSQESFDRMLKLAEKAGARVCFVVAPTTGEMSGHPKQEPAVPVFDFREMDRFAELYRKDMRIDIAHMNAKGAELFTRRLAEQFIDFAKSQPSTSR